MAALYSNILKAALSVFGIGVLVFMDMHNIKDPVLATSIYASLASLGTYHVATSGSLPK